MLIVCALFLCGAPLSVMAQDDLGVTMRMVTDDEKLTESVVREIELRDPVGLGPSENPAREAREARDRGRESVQSASERVREMREIRGRGNEIAPDIPEVPRPERPELPDQSRR
jgi:hypothetical protein